VTLSVVTLVDASMGAVGIAVDAARIWLTLVTTRSVTPG
jgi:hypothetical protein